MENLAQALDECVEKFGVYDKLTYFWEDGRKVVLTNSEILSRARSVAAGLEDLGVGKGDIVATVLSNVPEICEIYNGILRSGAVILPMIFVLAPKEIEYILKDSTPTVVITEAKLWPKVKEVVSKVSGIEKVVVVGNVNGGGVIPYEQFLKPSKDDGYPEEMTEDDLAILMYTSGTTGFPKGVMLTHYSLLSSMRMGEKLIPCYPTDIIIIVTPLNHMMGVLAVNESDIYGTRILLLQKFDPLRTLELISEYKVTLAGFVPTMIKIMADIFEPAKHSMKSIRILLSTGAGITKELLETAEKVFGLKIYSGYGCTEASPTITRQRTDRPPKFMSVGVPVPGLTLKLVDDEGREVSLGEKGEIICKGPNIMKGYWNKPEETAAALKDGWLHTGDIGRLDEDGELFIVGRKKDLIIKGGENIDPGISENRLYQHPSVMLAAVVGIPDEKYGEEVAAFVVLKPGMEVVEKEIVEFVREEVHHFFSPRRVFFLDSLPMTAQGKIKKNALREMLVDLI